MLLCIIRERTAQYTNALGHTGRGVRYKEDFIIFFVSRISGVSYKCVAEHKHKGVPPRHFASKATPLPCLAVDLLNSP